MNTGEKRNDAQSTAEQPLKVDIQSHIATVIINRPHKRNALTLAMWRELPAIFAALGANPRVRTIILTGTGGSFSAGADISEFGQVRSSAEQALEYESAVDACCDAIAATPKATIAVIDGFCMGGGCHVAMCCDFRFTSHSALFSIPAARLSIVYGLRGTQRLLALVGLANSKRILYSAQRFNAQDALRIGFSDQVAVDPMTLAREFCSVLGSNAPLTISGAKSLLNGLAMTNDALNSAIIHDAITRAAQSNDYREGRQAFIEKRQPVFQGN